MAKSDGRSSRYFKEVTRPRVLKGTHCAICGYEFPDPPEKWPHPKSKVVDHIVPLSHLGPNDPRRNGLSNCRLACADCNAKRGDAADGPEDPTGGAW